MSPGSPSLQACLCYSCSSDSLSEAAAWLWSALREHLDPHRTATLSQNILRACLACSSGLSATLTFDDGMRREALTESSCRSPPVALSCWATWACWPRHTRPAGRAGGRRQQARWRHGETYVERQLACKTETRVYYLVYLRLNSLSELWLLCVKLKLS